MHCATESDIKGRGVGWRTFFFLLTGFSNFKKKKKIHVKPSGSSGKTNASLTQHWLSTATNRNQCQSQGTFRNSSNWSVSFLSVNSEPWWLMTKLVWGAGRGRGGGLMTGSFREILHFFFIFTYSELQLASFLMSPLWPPILFVV